MTGLCCNCFDHIKDRQKVYFDNCYKTIDEKCYLVLPDSEKVKWFEEIQTDELIEVVRRNLLEKMKEARSDKRFIVLDKKNKTIEFK